MILLHDYCVKHFNGPNRGCFVFYKAKTQSIWDIWFIKFCEGRSYLSREDRLPYLELYQ